MSLQVSALADLEARIASLGGLLNSFSSGSGDGGSSSALPQQQQEEGEQRRRNQQEQQQERRHHRSREATSAGVGQEARGAPPLRPLPPLPPLPREERRARPRSTSPVPLALMRARAFSSSSSSSSSSSTSSSSLGPPGYKPRDYGPRGGDGGGGVYSASGPSLAAYSSPAVGREARDAGGIGTAGEASDLAREIDALLQASGGGGGSGGGDSDGVDPRVFNDAVASSAGVAARRLGDWRVHADGAGASAAAAAAAERAGLEEKTEASSLGWGELEGMADRLGALAAQESGRGGAARMGAERMLRAGGGSGYSSSRDL
ncbi:unnamed protein product, partial [Hapterophycus canaliculatus]